LAKIEVAAAEPHDAQILGAVMAILGDGKSGRLGHAVTSDLVK
jgi:hypothetical protein